MHIGHEAELARVEKIIADADRRIERQRELIHSMSTRGLAIDDACKTLEVMLSIMEILQSCRAALLRLSRGRLQ
jgi:hypothetical protein